MLIFLNESDIDVLELLKEELEESYNVFNIEPQKNEQICKLCSTPGHDDDCSAERPYCHHCSESSPVSNVESNGWNTILVTDRVQSEQTTRCQLGRKNEKICRFESTKRNQYIFTFKRTELLTLMKLSLWHHDILELFIQTPLKCNKCRNIGHARN